MLNNVYNKKDFWVIFTIYIVVLAKSLYASRLGFGLLDEGEYLHIGLRILRGDIPYRDFFSYLPALYDYWNAFAFKLFGVSVYSPRLLNSIIFSFVPVLFYLIAKRFSSKLVAFTLALALGFMEGGMERLYYHVFTFASLLCFFLFLTERKKGMGFLAGLLIGTTALFRLDTGVEFFLGMVFAAIIYKINSSPKGFREATGQLTTFAIGFFIPIAGFLVWLIDKDALSQFTNSVFAATFQMRSAYSLPFPGPWEILPQNLSPRGLFYSYEAFFAYLILTVYFFGAMQILTKRKRLFVRTPELLTFLLIGIFTAPYVFGRTDLGHLIKGGLPAFFIAAYVIEDCKRVIIKKLLLAVPVLLILVGVAQVFWWSKFFDTIIQTPKGNIRTNAIWISDSILVSANSLARALAFIEKNSKPNDQILALPYMAGLYFLSDRPSKSYEGNVFYSYLPDEQKFVDDLDSLDPKVVIYDPINGPVGELRRLKDYYPKIDAYVTSGFKTVETTPEGWLFMVRK